MQRLFSIYQNVLKEETKVDIKVLDLCDSDPCNCPRVFVFFGRCDIYQNFYAASNF